MSKLLLSKVYTTLVAHKWIVFLIWALWLTLEYFALGPDSYVRIHDWGDSILPMWMGSAQGFSDYGFSYWSTLAACGFDRLVALGPLFRIDTLLLFIAPGWLAVGLVAFFQHFIAGYFTYRLCRDFLKLGESASLIAGLAYSTCFFYFQSGFGGEAGFPLILWTLEYVHQKEGLIAYLGAVLLGAFVLFSSNFALSIPFILVMSVAWFVLVRRIYSLRFLSLFAAFSVVLLIGEIPWILAALSQSPISHRIDWIVTQGSVLEALNRWNHSVFDVYTIRIMMGCLALSILGLAASKLRVAAILLTVIAVSAILMMVLGLSLNTMIWVFVGIAILDVVVSRPFTGARLMVLLLLAFCMLAYALQVAFLRLFSLGSLSSFQFDRFYLLAPFFAVVAGAHGLSLVRRVKITVSESLRNRIKYSVTAIMCVLAICVLVFFSVGIKSHHYAEWVSGARYSTLYENPQVELLKTDAGSELYRVATVYHDGLHPAYANAYGLEAVDGDVPMYLLRYKQYWGMVIEPLTSVDQKYYDYFHGWGCRIYLFAPSSGEFDILDEVSFADYYNLDLLALANTKYIISPLPLSHENLKLVASPPPNPESPNMSLLDSVRRTRDLYIYENELCLPRFFVCDSIMAFDNEDDLLQAIAEADTETLRENVFVEQEFWNYMDTSPLGLSNAEVEIQMNSPDRITLSIETDGRGILVITNSYSPYWTCKVNGLEKDIFPVYHTFMGVFLEESQNKVELEYCPPYWTFW